VLLMTIDSLPHYLFQLHTFHTYFGSPVQTKYNAIVQRKAYRP
jgi:hypothetical protein